jgi:hypothetical protein
LHLFELNTAVLIIVLFGVILGSTGLGMVVGRSMRNRPDGRKETLAVMHTTLLGFMGLVLAFGLSLAVGRYEARRAAVVSEANAIDTTYLRAQTLIEPVRTESIELLERYVDISIRISHVRPGSPEQTEATADSGQVQHDLWGFAGEALVSAPEASAPRLYVEALNQTFEAQSSRVAGLGNRVPTPVLLLEMVGAAIALGLLACNVALLGRGVIPILLAALLVSFTLFVTFDLDRPSRGFIQVPSTPLDNVEASMDEEPAAEGPDAERPNAEVPDAP